MIDIGQDHGTSLGGGGGGGGGGEYHFVKFLNGIVGD